MTIVQRFYHRCSQGFTTGQKLLLTAAAVVYVLSPIDLAPDVLPLLGQLDDLTVLVALVNVWISPTNPPGSSGGVRA